MTTTNEIPNETFKKVESDFKIRWQRPYRWSEFQVSDYLRDAPVEAFESLARTIFTKIQGDECSYSDKVIE